MSTVFALPPGVDFPAALVDGLLARYGGLRPEDFARIELWVNTRRMERRIALLFQGCGARLLPRIRLIADLGRDLVDPDLPPSVPPIRRRLDLARLVQALLDADPDLAPRSALYDLADSLAAILDEMQGEGVGRAGIARIDDADATEHWRRRRAFLEIVLRYLEATDAAPDPERRQRLAVERLSKRWADAPPLHPVIVAGSTGSRGTTAAFMTSVAGLPDGRLVLPGYDFQMTDENWRALGACTLSAEDHPQYRFRRLMERLDLFPADIRPWTDATPPAPARNRLVSLALRPAPVTHQWMTEGPSLGDPSAATQGLSLLEAPSPHAEALAIATRLRKAAEDGTAAALISPDRMLTRRVAAQLDRWGIVPDDSAGTPLAMSPPGRLLRHVAGLMGQKLTAEALLVLLKHPLTHGRGEERGRHLLHTRDLELHIRRHGPPFPDRASLEPWADKRADRGPWLDWLFEALAALPDAPVLPLADLVARHADAARRLATAPGGSDGGGLWDEAAGRKAREVMDELAREAIHGPDLPLRDYPSLLQGLLDRAEVRDPVTPHPLIMIWGTIEARVQGADLVILGGLNEGTWPALPDPEPWLSRQMRRDAGLLLPERRIGLSAHDFQQAIAAPEVLLTRAIRDTEAETVPSRWINRITNLLGGLPGGEAALRAMTARGARWLALSALLEPKPSAVTPAPRPSPRPPVEARPKQLSVTQIRTLIRDPYAIYAREILRLSAIDPLRQAPDAPLRGNVLHDIFETFVRDRRPETPDEAKARLLAIADAKLAEGAPWPVARRIWRAKLERIADRFVAEEADRRREGEPVIMEGKGALAFAEPPFTLTAKADRIDRHADGSVTIFDYKSGMVPSKKQIRAFDKQLLLEAIMATEGGFAEIGPSPVAGVAYIGLGSADGTTRIDLADAEFDLAATRARFLELIRAYADPACGYTSRRAMEREGYAGDYDHLARYGEWDESTTATPEDVP
jgi:ATP-dependent helicase/nuclease subunit B